MPELRQFQDDPVQQFAADPTVLEFRQERKNHYFPGFPRAEKLTRRLSGEFNVWYRSTAANAFAFQDRLLVLGDRYTPIYDDGQTFVLDLAKPNPKSERMLSRQ